MAECYMLFDTCVIQLCCSDWHHIELACTNIQCYCSELPAAVTCLMCFISAYNVIIKQSSPVFGNVDCVNVHGFFALRLWLML